MTIRLRAIQPVALLAVAALLSGAGCQRAKQKKAMKMHNAFNDINKRLSAAVQTYNATKNANRTNIAAVKAAQATLAEAVKKAREDYQAIKSPQKGTKKHHQIYTTYLNAFTKFIELGMEQDRTLRPFKTDPKTFGALKPRVDAALADFKAKQQAVKDSMDEYFEKYKLKRKDE